MIKTVGILGAGQLARMLAQPGKPMCLEFIFLDPAVDTSSSSGQPYSRKDGPKNQRRLAGGL